MGFTSHPTEGNTAMDEDFTPDHWEDDEAYLDDLLAAAEDTDVEAWMEDQFFGD
jgi:hypothetical protein